MPAIERVTDPPGKHFFGYYEKSPWDRPERRLLAHRVEFEDRVPGPDDEAEICLLDTEEGATATIGATTAWNFQQGSMLQWLGPDHEERIVHNDREGGDFVARIVDAASGEVVHTVPHPIYAPAPDGRTGFSIEFERLYHTRQGYGYAPSEPVDPAPAPADEGVYRVDLRSGERERLVSLSDLRAFEPVETMDHGLHWINHVQVAPTGDRIAFIHRWERPGGGRWWGDRLFCVEADGSDLTLLADGLVSHYDWRTATELVAWTREDRDAFHRYDLEGTVAAFAHDVVPADGHNSFSPDGNWMLTDTPREGYGGRPLELYDLATGDVHHLAAPEVPPVENVDLRCDFHPRWDRSSRRICFDSRHEGERQLYTIDVREITAPF